MFATRSWGWLAIAALPALTAGALLFDASASEPGETEAGWLGILVAFVIAAGTIIGAVVRGLHLIMATRGWAPLVWTVSVLLFVLPLVPWVASWFRLQLASRALHSRYSRYSAPFF